MKKFGLVVIGAHFGVWLNDELSRFDKQNIYHADLYRVNNLKDLNEIGFFDIINQKSWVFVEWPDLIINIIDSPYSIVKISNEGKQKRKLLIKNS